MKVLGIDEAGRGPVIGPLVFAGVMVKEGDELKLDGIKQAKDSKLIPHKIRIELDKKIKQNSEYLIISTQPKEIDAALLSDDLNLNWLEAYKQAEIINKLKPDKAIIDCPSINCKAYEAYLKKLLKNPKIILVVEHKADINYPICSAASILAKVKREQEMDIIKKTYGDTGPGYPANKTTQEFLKNNWNKYPEIFRQTWSTYKKYSNNKDQKNLQDY